MKLNIKVLVIAGWMGTGAMADGGVTVRLPDLSGLSDTQARALMAELAQVNVITSNCPGYTISDGEWTLITGSGDKLAARLGLDPSSYDRTYYGPAFKLLDDPASCDRIGPTARTLINQLTGMGGGTTPITRGEDGQGGQAQGGNASPAPKSSGDAS